MPPKGKGRGRGRGGGSSQQEQGRPGRKDPAPIREQQERPPVQEQLPPRPEPQQQPQRQEQPRHEPQQQPQREVAPLAPVKERTIDPEELGMQYKLMIAPPLPRKPIRKGNAPGRPIRLISNCYNIDLPSGEVYHYDVDIASKRKPPPPKTGEIAPLKDDKKYRCMSTKRNREIVVVLLQTNQHFRNLYAAYDGRKNLYTRKSLKISGPIKCNVQMPDDNSGPNDPRGPRTDDFEVTIQPVRKKDSTTCAINLDALHDLFSGRRNTVDQEAVMAVETIMRHYPCTQFFPVGRSFFYPPAKHEVHPLGGGREIWFGFHQSLRLGQWKPMVNLDITATTFYQKGPVLHYFADFLKTPLPGLSQMGPLNDSEIKRISKELKNMRVEVTHLPYRRKYRILNLTREGADRLKFTLTENGQEVQKTVAEYFRQNYNITLRYPHLPCIQGNPEAKKIYLPIEVCDMVEGQHCKKKLEEKQNAEMIKFTARPPKQRFDEIKAIRQQVDCGNSRYLQEFGMKITREPLQLEGRVLRPPSVRYCNETKIEPRDGSWDMRNTQFFRGADIERWVFISFSNPRFLSSQHMDKFAKLLVNIGNESGIKLRRAEHMDIFDHRRVRVQNVLTEMKQKFKADLAVIAVPSTNKAIYGEVKQAAETVLGLTTQCVKDENVVKKCNPALVSNLCQKINAKMGGINNSLTPGETPEILRRPVIIIGADVTHPSPSQDIKPSLAAAVGSLDAHPSRYAVTIRAQTNVDEKKQAIEIILDLKSMILDLLKAFYKSTRGKKPEKIIFYRDGVSEGQFDKVRDHEVKCIREACRTLEAGYEPGITFIVVQKRHHTRFMPQDHRDGVGKMRNIPPGTTVDNTVVHPLNFDFFLCSHYGLQGTSRPCHYTVIEDDNSFSADDLHKLTYYLCHTYVRCTKSISSPAPVMYAHLAAFRARQHLVSQIDESSAQSSDSSSSYHPLPQAVLDAIKVIDGLKNTMYFV